MPLSVDNLNENSTMEQIMKAISETMQKLMDEGKEQKEAAGQAYGMARKMTGKELKY